MKLSRYKISSVQKPKKKNFTLDLNDLNNLNDDLVIMKVYETSLDEEMQKINKIDKGHKKKDKLTPKTKLKFNFYRNIHQNNTDSSNYDGGPSLHTQPKKEENQKLNNNGVSNKINNMKEMLMKRGGGFGAPRNSAQIMGMPFGMPMPMKNKGSSNIVEKPKIEEREELDKKLEKLI